MNTSLAWLMVGIPALPLAAAVLTPILGPKILKQRSHWIAIAAIGAAFALSLMLLFEVLRASSGDVRFTTTHGFERLLPLWKWASISDAMKTSSGFAAFDIEVTLRADGLTSLMLAMVTFIALLVAIFSSGYMEGDPGYWRFYSYLSLFVFSMTMLVSVSNFLLLFVFWEAVGACSYLLIGFWYTKPEAVAAGKRAFLVNRIGDFGLALAIFLIWTNYGTLNFHDAPVTPEQRVAFQATEAATSIDASAHGVLGQWRLAHDGYITGPAGTTQYTIALAICLLLLLGCCGKSAQFPLHVWLPDAMEGPTPASALIHAATMVTAGVYLIARCTPLFVASPDAQLVVACIGGFTAFMAGVIALTQTDLKRVLAYSTVSQLGFMFLGLGAGTATGVTAGMFHLFTHAFFKALLFLGAGSVMHAMHHVIDMRRFSGLRTIMPITRWTFLIGCLALAGIAPFAGFFSKDEILVSLSERKMAIDQELRNRQHSSSSHAEVKYVPRGVLANIASEEVAGHEKNLMASQNHAQLTRAKSIYGGLFWLALATAFMTAFYTFRAYFLTFHGELKVPEEAGDHAHESPPAMWAPMVVLAVCSVVAGIIFSVPIFPHSAAGTTKLVGSSLHDILHWTPQLAEGNLHLVSGHVHADHLYVAGISTVAAVSGLLLAMYLYLGDRKEVTFLASIMNGDALAKASDVSTLTNAAQRGWIGAVHQFMVRIGLGGISRAVGNLILLLALFLSAPLLLFRFASPYKLSQNKLFFDEAYDWAIVKPLRGVASLAYLFDRYLVDAIVNFLGRIPSLFGGFMRSMQSGLVQFYALAMILGAVALLAARFIWAME